MYLEKYPKRGPTIAGGLARRPIAASLPTLNKWDLDRLFEKIATGPEDRCWPWTGGRSSDGYGRFKVAGKLYSPHRLIAALFYGPITNAAEYHGSVVLHSCDNPQCCNPDHLRVGTQLDNVTDMYAKGRGHQNPLPRRVRPALPQGGQ